MLYHHNFDTENIVTPVDPKKLRQILTESNYIAEETEFLVDGFTNGFSLPGSVGR